MKWFFEHLASPLATIIAASAAVAVTVFFNKRLVTIANDQKNIALDKLKHDLFEKRYKIYVAARTLIEVTLHQSDFQKLETERIRDLRVTLDEARFFFGPSVRERIAEINATAEALLVALGEKWKNDEIRREPSWTQTMSQLGNNSRKLSALYVELPQIFEAALRFDQLVRD